MKKIYLSLVLSLGVFVGFGQVLTEPFDDATGFTLSESSFFADTFGDYLGLTDGAGDDDFGSGASAPSGVKSYSGFTGRFLTGMDLDGEGAALPITLTWTGLDITGLSNLEFSGDFAESFESPGDIDASDYLLIEAQIDGAGFNKILEFRGNGDGTNEFFAVDSDFDGIGDGTTLNGTAQNFKSLIGSTGSTLDLRFSVSVNAGDEDFAVDNFIVQAGTIKPEPSNHVSSFTAVANGASQIDLAWNDNDGTDVADGFLIIASTGSITSPTDAVDPSMDSDLSDGNAIVKVNSGVESYSFTGLSPSTSYSFEIYPFSNSGSSIDYKTDGTVPSESAMTLASPYSSGDVVITEIMYNTPGNDEEWIEIYNATGSSITFDASWSLSSTSASWSYDFDGSLVLASETYATIQVGTDGAFPFTPNLVRSSSVNQLNNTSNSILITYSSITIDEVTYDDGDDIRTDGTGPSYEIVDLAGDNSNTSSNWQASVADGGSPGAASAVTIWSGSTDTDWSTASNWSNGLPSASLNAVIPDVSAGSNNSPSLSGSSAVNDLDIASGVIVTLTSEASLIINDQTIGSGQVTVNKTTPHGASDGQYSIIGSPVESAMTNVLGSIVYSYDESFDYGANGNGRFSLVTVAETMSPGDAYFSANTGDITFTGIPNTGTITQTLVYDEIGDGSAANAGFNLVSNPYTAAIDVDLLVAGNDDIDASIYLWQDESSNTTQGSNDDYVVYNSMLNESTRTTAGGKTFDGFLRSAQGFFVKATDATSVSFTPTMMSTGNNDDAGFYRTEKEVTDLVRLSISNGELYSDAIIALRDDATEGVDRLYDAYSFAGSALNIYSFIGNDKFAIQGLPNAGSKTIIDLGFRAELEGELTIKLEEGKFEGYQVYLLDTELEEMVDLSSVESYSFETGQVSNSKRFQLVLSVNEVLSFDSNIDKADFTVYASSSTLSIRTLEAFETANIKVFSIDGSSILEVNDVNLSEKAWNTSFNKTGIFIMTIETPNGLLVKKFLN